MSQPTDHPDSRNHTRAFYDRISHVYDRLADSSEHEARDAGLAALDVRPGERVLEIGYGTGSALVELARAAGESGTVVGIDLSPGMQAVARDKLQKAGLADRVTLDVGDAMRLPYPDDSFDAATLSFTLELFPLEEIPDLLAGIRRVLPPGGRLGVVSMAKTPEGQHESLLTHVYKWMHVHFPHWVDCRPIDTRGLLEGAGFEITAAEQLEIWTLPVDVLVAVSS